MSHSPTPLPDDPWTTMSAAAATALARWRAAHPAATLAEIERAVDAHLSAARAALITTTAADPEPGQRPVCGELDFVEAVWRCPACGAGLPPPR